MSGLKAKDVQAAIDELREKTRLTDETAALFGGVETVNEALRAIGIRMNFHCEHLITSGTWVAPDNIAGNKIHVMAFGGGGGGGSGGISPGGTAVGGGGGGSGYMEEKNITIRGAGIFRHPIP